MKTLKNFYFFLAIASLGFFQACGDDDDNGGTTAPPTGGAAPTVSIESTTQFPTAGTTMDYSIVVNSASGNVTTISVVATSVNQALEGPSQVIEIPEADRSTSFTYEGSYDIPDDWQSGDDITLTVTATNSLGRVSDEMVSIFYPGYVLDRVHRYTSGGDGSFSEEEVNGVMVEVRQWNQFYIGHRDGGDYNAFAAESNDALSLESVTRRPSANAENGFPSSLIERTDFFEGSGTGIEGEDPEGRFRKAIITYNENVELLRIPSEYEVSNFADINSGALAYFVNSYETTNEITDLSGGDMIVVRSFNGILYAFRVDDVLDEAVNANANAPGRIHYSVAALRADFE